MSTPACLAGDQGHFSKTKMLEELEAKAEDGLISHMEDDDDDEESPVPDGGWGWAVCAASFMVNFILDGTMFTFGIFMLRLLDDLKETKAITSWVGSAQLGVQMMMGPVVSLLLKRFSIRQVTVAGTLISTAGFIASVFAPNVYVLIIMYGVVGGIGFGMIFLPAIIVVGLYFSKRRAIATGIATSGSGVGTFAYSYLCDKLLQIFTWRQTILILSGILLNCLACGMIFRPLVPACRNRKSSSRGNHRSSRGSDSSSSDCSTYYEHEFEDEETASIVKRSSGNGRGVDGLKSGSFASAGWLPRSTTGLAEIMKKQKDCSSPLTFCLHAQQLRNSRHQHHRRHHHHHHKHHKDGLLPEPINCFPATGKADSKCFLPITLITDERLYRSVDNFASNEAKPAISNNNEKFMYFSETQLAPEPLLKEANHELRKGQITLGLMRPILRKDIYYSGSVSYLAEYQQCGRSMTSFLAHMTQPESDDSGCSVSTSDESEENAYIQPKWAKMLRSVVDVSLFKSPAFISLLITCTLWTGQSVPLTYLPNFAVSRGVSRDQAAFLISIVGITNTAGRILAGFITDTLRIRSIWLYVVALLLAAAVNYAIPWCSTFPLLASASSVFGLCMAVAVSMRTIVLAEQLGIEVLTQSFGVVALFQGLAFTVNPPIAGKLFDETGAYFWPFIMAGTMYFIAALCSLAVGLWFKPRLPTSPSIILSVEEVHTESSTDSGPVAL